MNYHDFIATGLRMDSRQKEYDQLDDLLGKLTNHRYDYATHSVTGIVYDVTIIKEQLNKLGKEIREAKEKMNEG